MAQSAGRRYRSLQAGGGGGHKGAPTIGHCIFVLSVAHLILWKGDLDVLLRLYVHAGALQAPPTTAAGVAPVKNTHTLKGSVTRCYSLNSSEAITERVTINVICSEVYQQCISVFL